MVTARRFALAMGMTAMAVACVAGIWKETPLPTTLIRAAAALVIFAAIGYVCGMIGSRIMKDAVKTELNKRTGQGEGE